MPESEPLTQNTSQVNLAPKTVDEWLNGITYAEDGSYLPSDFALEFINFLKLVNGGDGEENETPVLHFKMLDQIAGRKQNVANLVFRGSGKTSVTAEYLFLYLGTYGSIPGFGKVELALYVSDSIDNGVKNMRKNLEHRWENSDFLRTYIPQVKFTDIRWEFINSAGNKFIVKGYGAKALALDTRLYTEDGYTTVEKCKVGDYIYGPDGNLAEITAKSEIFHKPMYKIVLEDGRELKVSEDHINSVIVNSAPNGTANWEDRDLTTKELLEIGWVHTKKGNKNHKGTSNKCIMKVRNTLSLQYPERDFQVDPYTLGVILGDGSIKKSASGIVVTGEGNDTAFYRTVIPYALGEDYYDKRRANTVTFAINGINEQIRNLGLDIYGLSKFIPECYFFGSVEQRLALLQGIMDTGGTVFGSGRIVFGSSSVDLANDVARLVWSLGGKAKISKCSNGKYKVEIWMGVNPFKLPRKADKYVSDRKHWNNCNIVDICPIDDEPSQCIAINSPSHQFLAGEYFRTHNTGVRGTKEAGKRPKLAILDDIVSDEDARSPTVIASIEDTVYKAVDYALHPTNNKIIWSGTPFNARDPLYKAVESGAWYVNVYPVCEKFPCGKEEFKSAWPDRFTYEYVLAKYNKAKKTGKIDTFNQEMMLRIMSDEERLVTDNDIVWYERGSVLKNKGLFNFYITTDFATSEKTSSDFSVISVWAYNNNQDWLWVDGVVRRQLMDRNVDDLFRFVSMYKPQEVGIEISGQQKGFVSWIRNEMIRRNVYFSLASDTGNGTGVDQGGIRPSTNKLARFNVVLPLFKSKKIYLPEELKDSPEMREALDELTLASVSGFKSKHDDFIDTVSMLANLRPWAPSHTGDLVRAADDDIWGIEDMEDDVSGMDSYVV